MSSVVIAGDSSGQITLAAPAVAGTTTLTLPATTGTVLNDATVGVCRAWVNFNGTGTVAIRASFNVSSITDNGTGDYTVNFTTAMPDENYSVAGSGRVSAGATAALPVFGIISNTNTMTTSAVRVGYRDINGSYTDGNVINVAIFR